METEMEYWIEGGVLFLTLTVGGAWLSIFFSIHGPSVKQECLSRPEENDQILIKDSKTNFFQWINLHGIIVHIETK